MSDLTTVSVRSGSIVGQGSSPPGKPASVTNAPVWSRALIVFFGLVLVKVRLVLGQGESLYEMHWRLGGVRPGWVDGFAFFWFVILGGLTLIRLGKSCRSVGTSTVRVANAAVMVLSLFFLFLTFHNGDKNLLYPVLSGVLDWTSLSSYSANLLFFNEPFLAAWIFVYVSIYYVLVRTGREDRVMSLTAAFAVAYGLLNLRDLTVYRHELLLIDCLAGISLVMAHVSGKQLNPGAQRLRAGWLLLPLAWSCLFAWALLRSDNQWHSNAAKYFLGLAVGTLVLFTVATLFVRRFGNPPAWSWLMPFFITGFFLLADANYPSSRNYNNIVCLGLTFPRYFAGDAAVVACVGLLSVALRKQWPRAGLWFMDFTALILILMAIVDLRLSQIMGVRLGWDVLSFGDSPKMMLKMARPYLGSLIFGLFVLVLLYALALRAIRIWTQRAAAHRLENQRESVPDQLLASHSGAGNRRPWQLPHLLRSPGLAYLTTIFIALSGLGIAIAESDKAQAQTFVRLIKTSPLWKRVASRPLSEQEFLHTATALGLGNFSTPSAAASVAEPRNINVLVVFMESSYNKHLSLFGSTEDTQPELARYKDRMEIFPNFFSAFTASIHARFATFTSLYPVLDFHAFTQERIPVKSLFEVLHDNGYRCSMFYSSYFDYTGFRDFLKNRGLDEMYDADSMPGQRSTERVSWGLLEEETLGAIRGQLKKYAASQQRFFLTYVPAAPHYPYDRIPKRFQAHKMATLEDFTPLYLNELLYMDWVIASILDELKETGLFDSTLVVITNDHGEMVGGKDGHVGHGWAVTPQLANTPLILMDPARRGFQTNTTIGTQVDLLPTILDRLNIPIPQDQLYEGLSLDAGSARQGRFAYLNSYKEFGVISGDQVLLGDREASSPSGVASSGAVYKLSNQGTATVFTLQSMEPPTEEASTPVSGTELNGGAGVIPACTETPQRLSDKETEALGTSEARRATMVRFDAFQENLLRNYDFYSRLVRVHAATRSGVTKNP